MRMCLKPPLASGVLLSRPGSIPDATPAGWYDGSRRLKPVLPRVLSLVSTAKKAGPPVLGLDPPPELDSGPARVNPVFKS